MSHDVVIVGGGPAGLSAALTLGRARRPVLVVDSGAPANEVSSAIGGLLGQEGVDPARFREISRRQLAELPSLEFRDGRVAAIEGTEGEFTVRLEDGATEACGKVLLAHGLVYGLPELPGVEEIWGSGAYHCPFCDGWEVCNQPIAVYGEGEDAVRYALLLKGWTDDLVLLTDGPAELSDGERGRLAAAEIPIREERVAGLGTSGGKLSEIRFDSGAAEERTAMFFIPDVRQPNDLAERLGCRLGEAGVIEVDLDGRTGVDGVFATGDAAAPVRSVAIAIGMGALAGKAIAAELLV